MNTMAMVGVVDDDEGIRDALQCLLEQQGFAVAAFASGEDFLAVHTSLDLTCAIVDIRMPGIDGLQLQAELTGRGHWVPLIFLTGHGSVPLSVRAMQAGAIDFLTKPVTSSHLLATIRAAQEIRNDLGARLEQVAEARRHFAALSAREQEIFSLNARGLSNKEIGAALAISHRTVETYKSRIMLKTGIMTAIGLAGLQWNMEPMMDPAWLLRYFPGGSES